MWVYIPNPGVVYKNVPEGRQRQEISDFFVCELEWRENRNRTTINLIKNELLIYFTFSYICGEAYEVFKRTVK